MVPSANLSLTTTSTTLAVSALNMPPKSPSKTTSKAQRSSDTTSPTRKPSTKGRGKGKQTPKTTDNVASSDNEESNVVEIAHATEMPVEVSTRVKRVIKASAKVKEASDAGQPIPGISHSIESAVDNNAEIAVQVKEEPDHITRQHEGQMLTTDDSNDDKMLATPSKHRRRSILKSSTSSDKDKEPSSQHDVTFDNISKFKEDPLPPSTPKRKLARTASVGQLASEINDLGVNSPKKKVQGSQSNNHRNSPSSPTKSFSKKRVVLDISDDEDIVNNSPSKKNRIRYTPPPDFRREGSNPFLDDEAEEDTAGDVILYDSDVSIGQEETREPCEEDGVSDDNSNEDSYEETPRRTQTTFSGTTSGNTLTKLNTASNVANTTSSESLEFHAIEDASTPLGAVSQVGECGYKLSQWGDQVCPDLYRTYVGLPPLRFVDYDLSFDGDLNMITLDLVLRQLRYIPAPGKFLTVGQRKEVDILKRRLVSMLERPVVADAISPTRANPKRFDIKQDPGSASNYSIVSMDTNSRVVFISFGACVASSLTGRQDHERKSVSFAPFCLDGLRLSGFAGNVTGDTRVTLNMFRGGLSVSTKVSRSTYSNSSSADPTNCFLTMPTRRRGMAQLGVNAGVVAANPTFYNDYLRDVSKRTALSASDDIPVIDLREWFTGAHRKDTINYSQVLMQAPRLTTEIELNSFIAIFHSMSTYQNKFGSTSLSLNLYAVAVLVGPSSQPR